MKRITIIAIVTVILCTFITGCSHTPEAVKEYEEWYEALQINEHKEIEYMGFSHNDNTLSLSIDCNYENLSLFNDVIKRHNEFVKKNPDYFPENSKINILSGYGTPQVFIDCYNKPGDYFGEISGEGIEEDNEIKYMSGDVMEFKYAYDQCKNEFSIPVLILSAHYTGTINHDDFRFLEQFKNVEQVIIYFSELDYNMEVVTGAVYDYCPDAEVYELVKGRKLKKW